jgi:hypothetical protein
MSLRLDGPSVAEIAKRVSALLDQQMRAISGRGLQALTNKELANYERRQRQIAALRDELNALANPN